MTLVVEGLHARYGQFPALSGVDLTVGEGKSTLLGAIGGAVAATGRVELDGVPLHGQRPHERARRGIATVPEGRRLFPSLSVRENLLMGAIRGRTGPWTVDAVHEMFPFVAELRDRPAGALSGLSLIHI